MSHRSSTRFAIAISVTALALLLLATAANASELTLKCGGKGARNKDSAGTVLCAAAPGKARNIEGVLLDDAGKPVAGKLTVTFSDWIPAGYGFTIKPVQTQQLSAGANGQFSISVKTATKVSVKVEAVADATLNVSAVTAAADVSRQLQGSVKKLGGGRVRVTVKGTTQPLKIAIVDESGYEVSGGKLRKANKGGSATFNLGSARGEFGYYVDAGELGDLFWEGARPTFRL
jgi:hypothetical protein